MLWLPAISWLFLASCSFGVEVKPTVQILNGTVQGYYDQTIDGRQFAAFEGIPYARPPVGKHRFREPQPTKPWRGIWQANRLYKCLQYNHGVGGNFQVEGEEDCLYLNVYTPMLSQTALLDVIVHIHGGAFMFNAADTYGHKLLMERNVVFVNFNYRLGPLGFLSTEDNIVPGNNGLKDQVQALRWIKENIQHFGGNPNSVTLTGMSAGGVSTHLHFVSPLSAGLFHRGMAMSGTAFNPWGLAEGSLEKAKQLAISVGCTTLSTREMIDCMKYRPATQIVGNVQLFLKWLYNPFSPFGPVVEKTSLVPFLPAHPYDLIRSGQVQNVPIIFSMVEHEGLYPAADFLSKQEYLTDLETRWNELSPAIMDYIYTVPVERHAEIADQIKTFYLKGQPISNSTFIDFVKMVGDRLFASDIDKAVRVHARAVVAPVYFYYFTYRGANCKTVNQRIGTNDNYGVGHADDTIYILSNPLYTPETTESDKQMKKIMLDMWTTFARTGVPTINGVQWDPVSKQPGSLNYLHIATPQDIKMESAQYMGNRQFWDSLPFAENQVTVTVREDL